MKEIPLLKLPTIAKYHQVMQLPEPVHPLVSVVRFEDIRRHKGEPARSFMLDYYSIALKRDFNGKMKYGQQEYDFDNGIMAFIAPGQVFTIEVQEELTHSGWMLMVHPDFLWNTPLAKSIRQYDYFSYSANEALHLSENEEAAISRIMQDIEQECRARIDPFSQSVILAQFELLLVYAQRFYQRQFITRKVSNHRILNRLEELLDTYFKRDELAIQGAPTVQYIADALHVSPNYLSALLKSLTGKSTQHHIQDKLIEKAKEKLSTTTLTVSEIAYELGFEHSQSFSKLFKNKTTLSPLEFRQSFN